MITVYAIKSKSRNYIYVGMSADLDRRIAEHNNGRESTTRPYAPFELLFSEEYPDRNAARQVEKQLKSGFGKEYLHSLINK